MSSLSSMHDAGYSPAATASASGTTLHCCSSASPSPSPRQGHTMVQWRHYLYIYGGRIPSPKHQARRDRVRQVVGDLWRFDLRERRWSEIASSLASPSPAPRQSHSAIVHRTGMYVSGGSGSDAGDYLNDVWRFDFETEQWRYIATLPTGLMGHTSVVIQPENSDAVILAIVNGRAALPSVNTEEKENIERKLPYMAQVLWLEIQQFEKQDVASNGVASSSVSSTAASTFASPSAAAASSIASESSSLTAPILVSFSVWHAPWRGRCWHSCMPISPTLFVIHGGYFASPSRPGSSKWDEKYFNDLWLCQWEHNKFCATRIATDVLPWALNRHTLSPWPAASKGATSLPSVSAAVAKDSSSASASSAIDVTLPHASSPVVSLLCFGGNWFDGRTDHFVGVIYNIILNLNTLKVQVRTHEDATKKYARGHHAACTVEGDGWYMFGGERARVRLNDLIRFTSTQPNVEEDKLIHKLK